jgi:SAM-dependent methyltransferase
VTADADKWVQYFDVYYRYFAKYAGKEVHFLEIGVQSGGSIELWKAFFGPGLHYYGVDINPYTKPLFESQGPPSIKVFVGSQSDRAFWQSQVLPNVPKLDIVLDDGGHTMEQQIVTFEEVYKHVKPEGIYIVEDCATSYRREWGGGYRKPDAWIEYSKSLIDTALHADHYNNGANRTSVTESTMSIAYYDQMVVFEKGSHTQGAPIQRGDARMDYMPPTKNGAVDPEVLKTLQERYKKAP